MLNQTVCQLFHLHCTTQDAADLIRLLLPSLRCINSHTRQWISSFIPALDKIETWVPSFLLLFQHHFPSGVKSFSFLFRSLFSNPLSSIFLSPFPSLILPTSVVELLVPLLFQHFYYLFPSFPTRIHSSNRVMSQWLIESYFSLSLFSPQHHITHSITLGLNFMERTSLSSSSILLFLLSSPPFSSTPFSIANHFIPFKTVNRFRDPDHASKIC